MYTSQCCDTNNGVLAGLLVSRSLLQVDTDDDKSCCVCATYVLRRCSPSWHVHAAVDSAERTCVTVQDCCPFFFFSCLCVSMAVFVLNSL